MQQAVPYMDTMEVLLGKESQEPAGEPRGYGKFRFKLNTAPDPVWKELFSKRVPLIRDAKPSVEGKSTVLRCDPGNAQLYYGYIKTAIGKTNVAYKAERESVVQRVKQEMARRVAAIINLLKAATQQYAEQFGSDPVVATTLAPYDEDQDNRTISRWFDPLLYWSLRNCQRCQRWPRVLILLHNWGNEASSLGTVMSNVAYTEECWQNVKRDNPSFRNMFDVTSWSRRLIASGCCLVANAAWGLWKSDKTSGMFKNRQVYYSALKHLWLPLAVRIQPARLYLCGRWARDGKFVTDDGTRATSVQVARTDPRLRHTKVILHYHPYMKVPWENGQELDE
jgi:hypothetical protein